MALHSSTLAWENPMDRGAWWDAVHGVTKSRTRLSDFTFTFHFQALEKEMATHSSVLAWRIPGVGEPGGLPSMGSHRVGHDWSDLAAAVRSRAELLLCLSSVHSFKILQQHLLWGCSVSTKSVQSSASGFSFALCFRDGLFARSSFSAIPPLSTVLWHYLLLKTY